MPDSSSTSPLAGRVALVTGGGTGIGRAIAARLARDGASVVVTGRRAAPLDATVDAIAEAGGAAVAATGDVADADAVRAMIDAAIAAFGGLHIVVNNAAIARFGPLEDLDAANLDALLAINVKGVVHVAQAAAPHLQRHADAGGAALINISSSVTRQPVPGYAVYAATKAAVDQLTRNLAIEWAGARVRVNAVCPGVIETPIFDTMMPKEDARAFLKDFAAQVPLGRNGQPGDIAALVRFLAGPEARWLTGAIIPLDGGLSLKS
ncbi:MAG: glucose 1-dehydrogenase [Acidobacteriota bacterium]